MTTAILPLAFGSEEFRLLTAIVIGFVFGLSLEGAGFGNARKLAAQFYLYDMTVFKVMFTAVLVAMVGLYTLVGAGVVDLTAIWINPTYMWAQVVGGFLMGVGFIMAGLCPGTSVVSLSSGRYDGIVAFAGIMVGSLVFALAVDWFPQLEWLYEHGRHVSLLPHVFHLSFPVVMLGVVVIAVAGFVGAEKVEQIYRARYGAIELTPPTTRRSPRVKFALGGALVAVALVSLAWKQAPPQATPVRARPLAPIDLAEAIIAAEPDVMILDLRSQREGGGIPGAFAVTDSTAIPVLAGAIPETRVVVYDEDGFLKELPATWPPTLDYYYLEGGLGGWRTEVLTPATAAGFGLEQQAVTERQQQIAAFFSGSAVATTVVAPPPLLPSGGSHKKKERVGGC